MNREIVIALTIGLIISLMGCVEKENESQSVSEKAVRQVVEKQNQKFMETFRNGNMEAFSTLFVNESGSMMPPGQGVVMGREPIMDYMSEMKQQGISRIKLTTNELYPHKGYALEVGSYQIFVSDTQQVDHGKYMVYWKKSDGEWRIYRDIWNSSRPE